LFCGEEAAVGEAAPLFFIPHIRYHYCLSITFNQTAARIKPEVVEHFNLEDPFGHRWSIGAPIRKG